MSFGNDAVLTMSFTRENVGSWIAPKYEYTITLKDCNSKEICTLTETNFNLRIGFEANGNQMTLRYYVNGVLVGTATKTVSSNITQIKVSGSIGSNKTLSLNNGVFYSYNTK